MIDTKKTINTLLTSALDELYALSNSRKSTQYTLKDSLKHKHLGSERTKIIIDAFNFLDKDPLKNNDYYKYLTAYINNGIKLDPTYFKHDLDKLNELYNRFDKDRINHFNIQHYRDYVLFMSLKLNGCYIDTDDEIFNVSIKDFREYNPLTKMPSVLRGELPYKVKEYDITKAFPTFIDIELKSDYRHTVYDRLSKKDFASALNSHCESCYSLIDARETLKTVYSNRVDEVLTDERFNERGKAFKDFAEYEQDYINKFVKSNELTSFVRLHDGVYVLDSVTVENTMFDKVEFVIKECIKPEILNDNKLFYSFDDFGKVILTPTGISDFLKQEKFVRITTTDDKIQLLKNNNNVIDYFNHKTNIVSFLESKIIEVDKSEVKDAIARHNFSTITQSYSLISPTKLEYYKDTKNRFGLPFKNGFVYFDSLGKMELKIKSYDEVNGFFTPHKVQGRTFNYTDEVGDFETFVFRSSTGQKTYDYTLKEFQSLCSIIGYLATTYKKPNDNPIIVFTDEGANEENRNGRRGKSLVNIGLGEVTKKITKGNKEFIPTYTHNFAELDKSYNLFVIDDAPAGFDYNSLYTNTTGSIGVQPKGKAGFEIDFKDTPKFSVNSNYLFRLNKNDASTVARFVEFKFSPYYSIDNTPLMEFGSLFFDEWDKPQWDKFYSFIFRCVFSYLNNGIQRIDYNKDLDNYKATFNDANEELMTILLNKLTRYNAPFKVGDVTREFNNLEWYLRSDNFIHKNNAQRLVNLFIDGTEKYDHYKYVTRSREWQVR